MRPDRILTLVGVAAALVAAAAATLLPAYSAGGSSKTLAAANGDWVFALLAAFVLVAIAPLIARGAAFRWVAIGCGLTLLAASFATLLGIFFLPSGVALLAAGLVATRPRSQLVDRGLGAPASDSS